MARSLHLRKGRGIILTSHVEEDVDRGTTLTWRSTALKGPRGLLMFDALETSTSE